MRCSDWLIPSPSFCCRFPRPFHSILARPSRRAPLPAPVLGPIPYGAVGGKRCGGPAANGAHGRSTGRAWCAPATGPGWRGAVVRRMPRTEHNEWHRSDVSQVSASDAFVWIFSLIFWLSTKSFQRLFAPNGVERGTAPVALPAPHERTRTAAVSANFPGARPGPFPAPLSPPLPPSRRPPVSLTAAAPFISAAPAPPRRLGRAGVRFVPRSPAASLRRSPRGGRRARRQQLGEDFAGFF